jgi:hypothetical protein
VSVYTNQHHKRLIFLCHTNCIVWSSRYHKQLSVDTKNTFSTSVSQDVTKNVIAGYRRLSEKHKRLEEKAEREKAEAVEAHTSQLARLNEELAKET